jgi:hypothetical protein
MVTGKLGVTGSQIYPGQTRIEHPIFIMSSDDIYQTSDDIYQTSNQSSFEPMSGTG